MPRPTCEKEKNTLFILIILLSGMQEGSGDVTSHKIKFFDVKINLPFGEKKYDARSINSLERMFIYCCGFLNIHCVFDQDEWRQCQHCNDMVITKNNQTAVVLCSDTLRETPFLHSLFIF